MEPIEKEEIVNDLKESEFYTRLVGWIDKYRNPSEGLHEPFISQYGYNGKYYKMPDNGTVADAYIDRASALFTLQTKGDNFIHFDIRVFNIDDKKNQIFLAPNVLPWKLHSLSLVPFLGVLLAAQRISRVFFVEEAKIVVQKIKELNLDAFDELRDIIDYKEDSVDERFNESNDNINKDKHPLAQYIICDHKQAILKCLHNLMEPLRNKKPKYQLALIKAAMTCKPRVLSDAITIDIINREFNLNISSSSFVNWIKESRRNKFHYNDDELNEYKERLQAIQESFL